MSKEELQKEKAYLAVVYGELLETKSRLTELLKQAKEEGTAALSTITEDIRLNFDSYSDNLDTFSMIELKNREIDQMNIRLQSAENELKRVEALLKSPYFGKISVDYLDEEPLENFYIGISGFTNDAEESRIYDWRSPISELFYNNELGDSSYSVNERTIPVAIKGRRQFIIDRDQLIKYFDTSIAIQDDVLLEALENNSEGYMADITATIQKEQNAIIRDTTSPVILVNGIAGSGKTSTIMQRVAYLLYQLRQKITSDNILILSPNNQFIDYVSKVLPALGEKNPLNLTMLQFVQNYAAAELENEEELFDRISSHPVDAQTKQLRSQAFTNFVKNADSLLLAQPDFFTELSYRGKAVISKEKLTELYNETPSYSKLIDKLQSVKKSLSSYWERRLIKQARSPKIQNQILSLSEELQKKYFGELISDDSEDSIFRYGKKLLQKKYAAIGRAIRQNRWINKEQIFQTVYTSYSSEKFLPQHSGRLTLDEGTAFLLVEHLLIEKIDVPQMQFLLIDEVQDYTQVQLDLLIELFPKTEFTMVGDENQAIFNSTTPFEQIQELFNAENKAVQRYDLLSSYRSSGAITKTFGQFASEDTKMTIVPVRKDGQAPQLHSFKNQEEFLKLCKKLLEETNGEDLTIITKTEQETESLKADFENNSVDNDTERITIVPISLSKGLEFDHVLIYDISEEKYHSERDKKILYTAISRAMQSVYLTYSGNLSKLLAFMQ
ncbi:HelD family protein [Enterococcus sp. LJL51]|uniref:HelD family protein n=1 Tax=Enterococcus sp. LJL51 TaxID=3416656 RepID=UPI003CEE8CBB